MPKVLKARRSRGKQVLSVAKSWADVQMHYFDMMCKGEFGAAAQRSYENMMVRFEFEMLAATETERKVAAKLPTRHFTVSAPVDTLPPARDTLPPAARATSLPSLPILIPAAYSVPRIGML